MAITDIYHESIRALRHIYTHTLGFKQPSLQRIYDPDEASDLIHGLISSGKPCMIARFGAFELSTVVNYLGISTEKHSAWDVISGKQPQWWWNKSLMRYMNTNAGFFPPTKEKLAQFCEMMLRDMNEVDVLGSWIGTEHWVADRVQRAAKVRLQLIEPFWSKEPWTRVLKGKHIVVVHPFKETILRQYNSPNRTKLFVNPNTLPEFASLRVVKAVQSIGGGENSLFNDWFEALEWMKQEIDREPYDICLIGCGAYGFPLAAHVKRSEHQAIHLGGALQLLFGIRGRRWDNPNYGVKEWGIPIGSYSDMVNEYWVRPDEAHRPQNALQVEGGCYW